MTERHEHPGPVELPGPDDLAPQHPDEPTTRRDPRLRAVQRPTPATPVDQVQADVWAPQTLQLQATDSAGKPNDPVCILGRDPQRTTFTINVPTGSQPVRIAADPRELTGPNAAAGVGRFLDLAANNTNIRTFTHTGPVYAIVNGVGQATIEIWAERKAFP